MSFIQSIANMGTLIPLSFAGLGGNEAGQAAVAMMLGYGVGVAVFLAFALYSCKLVGAIEGGMIEWFEGLAVFVRKLFPGKKSVQG